MIEKTPKYITSKTCSYQTTNKRDSSDLEPGVSQCFTHTEPPSDRHLQQVVDETHSWRETDAEVFFLVVLLSHPVASRRRTCWA